MQEVITGGVNLLALMMSSSTEEERGTHTSQRLPAEYTRDSPFHEVAIKYTAHGSQAEREALQGQLDEVHRLERLSLRGDGGEMSTAKLVQFVVGLTSLIDVVLEKARVPCIALHVTQSAGHESMSFASCFHRHQASPVQQCYACCSVLYHSNT